MPVALIILLAVLAAIALRRMINIIVPIWAIMAAGAMAAIVFQQITPIHAITAVEPDVIIYLFGVFLICQAAETSGYLEHLTDRVFSRARTGNQALLIIVFALGISSALLMNDTIAILGTPIILQLCKLHKNLIKPLLLALAFGVTIGSAISPIGNPQNLLIAVKSQMYSPFYQFFKTLLIPTIINLIIAWLFLLLIYRRTLSESIHKPTPAPINNHRTVTLVKISMLIMICLIIAKIMTDSFMPNLHINFSYIAIISALPIFFSSQRWQLLKQLDWGTLLFFASTFILMQSVWNTGFFQANIQHFHVAVTQTPVIITISVILSQFISNVPLVALYLPLLMHHHASVSALLALAAGSTIAGNLSLLGAASNIIIVQSTESRSARAFDFLEFLIIGTPLTIINCLVYALFI